MQLLTKTDLSLCYMSMKIISELFKLDFDYLNVFSNYLIFDLINSFDFGLSEVVGITSTKVLF